MKKKETQSNTGLNQKKNTKSGADQTLREKYPRGSCKCAEKDPIRNRQGLRGHRGGRYSGDGYRHLTKTFPPLQERKGKKELG